MKFNEKELAEASNGPADIEGRLNHKRAHKSGFKEKWFKLRCNLLFYFNINELGQIDTRQPAGVIILENYSINLDAASEGVFAFSIAFRDEYEKRHVLSGRSESQVEQWVNALKQASYEYWRFRLIVLQEELCRKTGKDPLLMYPRNQGIIRDEAWEPASTFRSHVRSFTTSVVTSTAINTVTKEMNLIEF
ncbi:pleckstrin homology domain-containing family J member 1-like [Bombus vosnesenskii]|uniref:Pleckstrin homology domain-containing family J member 1-like n=4 Tax=Bombus TaxID=28641 RepID=A0A6J3K5A8_9HYME|nr:pleckstrin homology domain-containing family J member 1 [Bombus terrestris]XP_003488681.1 pleckstrin homology domain-containing family J member 1 [Bombus impatiens]XP_033189164.1 pleckstrin homology domain-containing family J member 1-like [Bombus vancouverensis nearcticus]XP_033300160.1 pleckstrin homology domain-containing family J member 1-like [Bombus bifarius]XP_033347765.1 pleckstrin homology domain-containing family J member 1-like [Bombus vosnesenskii]XP_043581901.1 pleckstrin homol